MAEEEHVQGRMPLESNPGNRNPGIPANFDTTGKEDYRRVSPDNPLPTKDKKLDERLTAIENKLDSVIENGAINTQLSGSNGEDGVPVRDINSNIVLLKERSHKDIDLNVPGNSQKIINESIDVGDYRYLIFQFIPSADGKRLNYRIKYHYSRGDSTNTMQEITVLKVGGSSNNQVSDKVEVLFKYIKVVIANEEEHDHEFGKYYILGVRK